MKMFIILMTFLTFSCQKKVGTEQKVLNSKDDYEVNKLFTVNGCTVYRFYDSRYHYFSDCSGTVSESQSENCGKTQCTYTEVIETTGRKEKGKNL